MLYKIYTNLPKPYQRRTKGEHVHLAAFKLELQVHNHGYAQRWLQQLSKPNFSLPVNIYEPHILNIPKVKDVQTLANGFKPMFSSNFCDQALNIEFVISTISLLFYGATAADITSVSNTEGGVITWTVCTGALKQLRSTQWQKLTYGLLLYNYITIALASTWAASIREE